jgi:hypothetical protein
MAAAKRSADAPLQTARFSVVVAKCGQPSVHLTLVAPAKDPALRRLETQGRVMTILTAHRGGGTDHGLVGIHVSPGMQLLIFPRSVRRFAGKRIVGINYDLLDQELHVTGRPAAPPPNRDKPARRPAHSAAILPFPQTTPSSREAREEKTEDRPPPAPLTLPLVLRRLRAIERLFDQKRPAAAREETGHLIDDVAHTLAPAKRRPTP